MRACRLGKAAACRLLIAADANVTSTDRDGTGAAAADAATRHRIAPPPPRNAIGARRKRECDSGGTP